MSKRLMGIEIEAFRVYKDRQFFDFITPNGEIANLVVIYAPNGFGKTSFFDAIEWSLTGEINRIKDNPKIRNIVDSEQGVILKNKLTESEFGRVKIINEYNDVIEVHTKKLGVHNRKTDYRPGSIIEQSDFFKNINFRHFLSTNVLGQDKIDSFLRFASPKERYNTLKNFWDHNNETSLYLDLLNVLQTGQKQETLILDRVKSIEEEVKILVISGDIFNSIRKIIDIYNKNLDEELQLEAVNEQINEIKLHEFIKLIIDRKAYFETKKQEAVNSIDIFTNINNNFQDYENNVMELKSINQELQMSNLIIGKEEEIENNDQEIKIKFDLGLNLFKEYGKLKSIYKSSDFFIKNRETINEYENKVYNLSKKLLEFVKTKNEIERKLNVNQKNIKENTSLIERNENTIEVLKYSNLKYYEYNRSKEKFDYFEKKAKLFITKREGSLRNLKNNLYFYNNLLVLERELLIENNYEYTQSVNELINEYSRILKEIESKTEFLNQKRKEYIEFGELNSQLNQIINIGRKIVKDTKTTSCPLCKQEYSDYAELLKKVDEQIDDKFGLEKISKEIDNYENTIKNLNKRLDEVLNNLRLEIRNEIRRLSNKIKRIEAKVNKNRDFINKKRFEKQKFKDEFEKSQSLLYNYEIYINNISEKDSYPNVTKSYIDLFSQKLLENRDTQLKLTIENTNLEKEHKKLVEEIQNNEMEVNEINTRRKEVLFNPLYLNIINLLNKLNIDTDYNKEQINNKLNETKDNLRKNNILKRQLRSSNAKLKVELKDLDIKLIRVQTEMLNSKRKDITIKITDFQSNWEKYNKNSLIKREIIQKSISTTLDYLNKVELKINDLIKLQEYTNILEDNIVRTNKLKEKAQLVEKLLRIKKANEKLDETINLGKRYILDKINEVFNVYSINNIYQRIEPHPDMKIIKFEPDFSGEKPEINIYASNKEEDVAPVIYFSAAQLNILSLSIFIARALENDNKDNLNTIFMDDPVQHLDSINILSFIDLLRTITTKENKQVILSTHNEQLYKLIQKKMDPNFTSSKFIELESFGKIKV